MADQNDAAAESSDKTPKSTFFSVIPPKGGTGDIDLSWAFFSSHLEIFASLGSSLMTMSNILKLGRGAVIELDQKPDDYVLLILENFCIAKAELIVENDYLALRIVKVFDHPMPL